MVIYYSYVNVYQWRYVAMSYYIRFSIVCLPFLEWVLPKTLSVSLRSVSVPVECLLTFFFCNFVKMPIFLWVQCPFRWVLSPLPMICCWNPFHVWWVFGPHRLQCPADARQQQATGTLQFIPKLLPSPAMRELGETWHGTRWCPPIDKLVYTPYTVEPPR